MHWTDARGISRYEPPRKCRAESVSEVWEPSQPPPSPCWDVNTLAVGAGFLRAKRLAPGY